MENELQNQPIDNKPAENTSSSEGTENWQNILKEFSDQGISENNSENPAVSDVGTANNAGSSPVQSLQASAAEETVNFSDFSNTTSSYVVKPYKKKKTGLVVLVVLLVLVALGAAGYYLYTQGKLPFAPKRADYEAAERAFISEVTESVNELSAVSEPKFNTAEITVRIAPSEKIAEQLGYEALNETVVSAAASIIGDKASIAASYMNGDSEVISGSLYKNGDKAWAYAPKIESKYIEFDPSGMTNYSISQSNPSQVVFEKLSAIDGARIDASIARIIDKYFESIGKVSSYEKEKGTVSDIEYDYRTANVQITDLIATDIAIAALNEVMTYSEITDLSMLDLYDSSTREYFTDNEQFNQKIGVQLQEALDSLYKYKAEHTTPDDEVVIMKVYLNKQNKIVGREIILPDDSSVSFKYITAEKGDKFAQEFTLTQGKDSYKMSNSCTKANGVYTGICTFTVESYSTFFNASVNYENIKEENDCVSGKVSISVPQISTIVNIDMSIPEANCQHIEIGCTAMGLDAGKIITDAKYSNISEIVIPEINAANSVLPENIDEKKVEKACDVLIAELAVPDNGYDLISAYLYSLMSVNAEQFNDLA